MKMAMDVSKKLIADIAHEDVNPIIIESLVFGPIHGLVMRMRNQQDIEISEKDVDDLVDFILVTIRKEMYERNS